MLEAAALIVLGLRFLVRKRYGGESQRNVPAGSEPVACDLGVIRNVAEVGVR